MRRPLHRRLLGTFAGLALLLWLIWFFTALERDPNELTVGTAAPAVALRSAAGEVFSWETFGDRYPVLVFYRGRW